MNMLSSCPSKIEWDLTNGPLNCDRAIRYSGFFQGQFRNGPTVGDFLDVVFATSGFCYHLISSCD